MTYTTATRVSNTPPLDREGTDTSPPIDLAKLIESAVSELIEDFSTQKWYNTKHAVSPIHRFHLQKCEQRLLTPPEKQGKR